MAFAIIITIMVLELALHVPRGADWPALAPLLPVFLAYALSKDRKGLLSALLYLLGIPLAYFNTWPRWRSTCWWRPFGSCRTGASRRISKTEVQSTKG